MSFYDCINEENFFETIKCNDEEVYNLSYHNKRIANTIGLNLNLQEYIYPPNSKLLKCKVIYNQDGIVDISYSNYLPRDIKSFKIIEDDNIEYKYKSTNRESLDNLFNQRKSADEIIIVKDGLITDTSIANIAILINDIWYTPKTPLLYGTTRNRLLEDNLLKEKDISVEELKNASKIALLNAMIDFKVLDEFEFIN